MIVMLKYCPLIIVQMRSQTHVPSIGESDFEFLVCNEN